MINFTPFTNRILASAVAFFLTVSSFGQWINGQAASKVLGQSDLTLANSATTADGMNWPTQIIVDPASGKIFVADWLNNRVLRFASSTTFSDGDPAEAVFGQSDMISGGGNTTINGLSLPISLAMDGGGRLYVSESGNNRVVRYDGAATLASGANASMVLGQPDFTSFAAGTTQNTMNNPTGVFISGNTLWVADGGNHRILRYDNASLKTNGANADGVLGQANFTSGGSFLAANRLNTPKQIFMNGAGDLWVADYGNNRVLKFSGAASLAPGSSASVVIGQTSFTANTNATGAAGMYRPVGVYIDGGDRLYVSSEAQNRILIYENAQYLIIGSKAIFVLGQTGFATTGLATTAQGLNNPQFLFVNNRLWVGDRNNNRVLLQTVSSNSLPLTLTGFKARKQGKDNEVLISWTTTEEINVKNFELQYSADGVAFDGVINRQDAKNGISNSYSYLHTGIAKSNYYRLKIVDKDGSTQLSPIVVVKGTASATPEISIYPNPLKGGQLFLRSNDVQQVKLDIYDVAGRLMKSAKATTLTSPVDVHELTTGIYTVRISYEGGVVTKQFVKQ